MASSSSHSPCAACKFLRRKCTQECVFAPYFPPDQPQKFASVHKVYGASNVAKILNELTVVHREEAAISLAYEAEARLRDPVFGCVGFITILHNRLKQIQAEVHASKKELATYIGPQAMMVMMPPPPSYGMAPPPPPTLGIQPANNASAQLFIREPMNAPQYHHQQQQMFNSGFDHVPPVSGGFSNQMNGGGGGSPSGGVVSPSLGLGGFDNVPNYHIQSQQQQVHPTPLDNYQLQTQLIISSQQKSEGDHQQN